MMPSRGVAPLPPKPSLGRGEGRGCLAPGSHVRVCRAHLVRVNSVSVHLTLDPGPQPAPRVHSTPPTPAGDCVLKHGVRGCAGVVAVEEQALVHPSDAAALPEVVVEEQQVLGHALRGGGCSPPAQHVPCPPGICPQARGGEAASHSAPLDP